MKPRFIDPAILLVSGVGIAYQIAMMRLFSIAQWHHFAYMVISIAMLGFGASGTFLTFVRHRIEGAETWWLPITAVFTAISLPTCYALSQRVPFETFRLVSEPAQLLALFALYVLLSIPFFLVACCITLAILANPAHIGRLYCVNMVGSGLGALGAVLGLFVAHPAAFPVFLTIPALAAGWLLVAEHFSRRARYLAGYGFVVLFTACALIPIRLPVRVSEYKGLSYALQLADAKVVAERVSPFSVVTAVHSRFIRETPGQVSNYPMTELGALPEQIGLYFDAGAVSPLSRFGPQPSGGDSKPASRSGLNAFAYLDYVTSAVAYRLVEAPRVLVMGAGGGADVLGALWHGAPHVTALEVDPAVRQIVMSDLAGFAGHLYSRPGVELVVAEGRGFLQSHREQYDLIQLPLFGSYTAVTAGAMALDESFLYTVEAFDLYLNRLSGNGVLATTCWLRMPPRDAVKLFATAVEACRRAGFAHPGEHLAFVRSWNSATIVVSRQPLDVTRIERIRTFCRDRCLDVCWYPGITPEELNRYTVLERPIYYEAACALLSSEAESFYQDYVFFVRPATDDRPHFFRFFKWDALPHLFRGMGTQWIPFVEWGYITLAATLIQAVIASVVLIVLPLLALRRTRQSGERKPWVLLYFASLGGAYMFLEIAFIQRFTLFLAHPIYSVAIVLAGFLFFSGLGSMVTEHWNAALPTKAGTSAAGISVLAVLYINFLPPAFSACSGWPDTAKAVISLTLVAPLAFCMGIPFPSGLQTVSRRWPAITPWALGLNAFASVVGATLATTAAVHLGFRIVSILAMGMYLISALSAKRLTT